SPGEPLSPAETVRSPTLLVLTAKVMGPDATSVVVVPLLKDVFTPGTLAMVRPPMLPTLTTLLVLFWNARLDTRVPSGVPGGPMRVPGRIARLLPGMLPPPLVTDPVVLINSVV